MGKIEEKYEAEVDAAMEFVSKYGKGDILKWTDLEPVIGRHRDEIGGWQIINRLRARLLKERQIVCLAEPTVGLRLLTDREAALEVPTLRQKKARRQINRGLKETDAVDVGMLSTHGSIALALARKHMKEQRVAISRGRRELEALTKQTR